MKHNLLRSTVTDNSKLETRNSKLPPNIWFLGIGGIGMSALARWFRARGHRVGGYDRTATPLTAALVAEGITVIFDEAVAALPAWVTADPATVLIVRTPAVPVGHAQGRFFNLQGYSIRKRSEVLGMLTAGTQLIAVAGTHGKTTTSSMVAHLLHHAGVPVAAFLGGIATNFNSNLLLPPAQSHSLDHPTDASANNPPPRLLTVVEADEYDRSFLTLYPTVAIVTSTDADHLDIYGDKASLLDSFRDFIAQIQPRGLLLLNHTADEHVLTKIDPTVRVIRYGLAARHSPGAEHALASGLHVQGRTFVFDLTSPFGALEALALRVPGFHNVENMVAAATVALHAGVGKDAVSAAVPAYAGVKRRFEFVYEDAHTVYVDDYAHHPREIEAFLRSLRALYPDRKLTAVFQPHLFSRTRDFAAGFAEALSLADDVLLLPIYPAREEPIPGVSSALIYDALTAPAKTSLPDKAALLPLLTTARTQPAVLATIGAGDIDTLVGPLREWLSGGITVGE